MSTDARLEELGMSGLGGSGLGEVDEPAFSVLTERHRREHLLGDSVNSVNSALQRARAGMREHLPAERQDWTGGEHDAGTLWVEDGFEGMTGLRGVLTSVNRQPAVAFYLWQEGQGAYLPLTIDVLRVTDGAITEIFIFHSDQFARLGLPERLPAQ